MTSKIVAFVVWVLVGVASVFWGMRLAVSGPSLPVNTVAVGGAANTSSSDLVRLMGGTQATTTAVAVAPDVSSRFRLLGIMAPRSLKTNSPLDEKKQQYLDLYGVALIQVDGKPPRAFKVGSLLDVDWVLQSVSLRSVTLSSKANPANRTTLEMPALAGAVMGVLPSVNMGGFQSNAVGGAPQGDRATVADPTAEMRPSAMPTSPVVVEQPGEPAPNDP